MTTTTSRGQNVLSPIAANSEPGSVSLSIRWLNPRLDVGVIESGYWHKRAWSVLIGMSQFGRGLDEDTSAKCRPI